MKHRSVHYKKIESIAVITLDRQEQENAITYEMASELAEICRCLHDEKDVKAVVLTGRGDTFSIGIDPTCYQADKTAKADMTGLSVASLIDSVDLPFIAAINGDAFGQGLELALACDLKLCSEKARFSIPALADGMLPFDGGTQRLPRLVGKGKAMEMILLGEVIDAMEAHRVGLVNRVVNSSDLYKTCEELALAIATKGPIAVSYAREAVLKGMDLTLEQGLRLEADLYYLLHTTRDREEGIRAFQEKRKADFTGE